MSIQPEPFVPAVPPSSTIHLPTARPDTSPMASRRRASKCWEASFPAPNRLKALSDALAGLATVLKAERPMSKRVAEQIAAVADVDSPRSDPRQDNRLGR